ncbi:MAG TPA: protease inhibitor I42 family protein [Mycobacteriales bacterium]|nr:protease inhibitor I42 family protein [Mycobacteriales bacterium]
MSTVAALVASAATAAALPAVTAQAAPAAAAAAKASHPHVYHLSDRGRTVHVAKGERFKVSLQQATDGGYEWVVTKHPDASILKYVGSKTHVAKQQDPAHPIAGAPTKEVFTFRAVGSGTTSFKLAEKRFGREKAVKRFKMTVKVS